MVGADLAYLVLCKLTNLPFQLSLDFSPASSYIGARNLTATPQVQCVPFVCPVGNRCSGLNGKSMGCLAGWAGAINSTVCNNCNTTRSYTSPNSTVCLGCNSFAATCSPISGDSLTWYVYSLKYTLSR